MTCRWPTGTDAGTAAPRRSGSASGPGAQDEPNEKYRDAHLWYDAKNKDNFTAYKLLFADVLDGKLTAIPRGIMAAGNIMDGARGGVDIPPSATSTGSRATWPGTTGRWATSRPGNGRPSGPVS